MAYSRNERKCTGSALPMYLQYIGSVAPVHFENEKSLYLWEKLGIRPYFIFFKYKKLMYCTQQRKET